MDEDSAWLVLGLFVITADDVELWQAYDVIRRMWLKMEDGIEELKR